MKVIYKILYSLFLSAVFLSCSSDDNDVEVINHSQDEISGLVKIQELTDENYEVSLYTKTGKLITGYNEIYLQLKNKKTEKFESGASLSWHPVMHMTSKSHSCPAGSIEKVPEKQTWYKGFILFQMAGSESEYWKLTLDYGIKGQNAQISGNLNVSQSLKRTLQGFTGTDNSRYVVTLVEPSHPDVGTNDLTAYLYKMQDMNTFVPVDGYTIKFDPRMPGMGNHSSPNNVDLTYTGTSGFYKGKVNLTMTGYWKINLIVLDDKGQVIKGETITETNKSSSIYWELEF